MSSEKEVRVLVTGFGSFLDITSNPSYTIATRLPSTLPSHPPIHIITHPSPIEVSYEAISALVPTLLSAHNPDIILHIGLAVERDYFAIEKGAKREGYHDVPDVKRRVFTRAENKRAWGKAPGVLECGLDLERVVERWSEVVRGLGGGKGKGVVKGKGGKEVSKGKEKERGGKEVDVRLSDDVGNFVCGFIYYASLLEREKRGQGKDVVFFHVPPLEGEDDIQLGVKVTEGLIGALVNVWREERL